MGNRVNKVIGYGVNNLEYEKLVDGSIKMTDGRIDWKIMGSLYKKSITAKEFASWMEENGELLSSLDKKEYLGFEDKYDKNLYFDYDIKLLKMNLKQKNNKIPQPYRCIIHNYEYEEDNPSALIIVPISSYPLWCRYDDIIDYIEETELYQRPRVKILNNGIFPYSDRMIRIRDPIEKIFVDEKEDSIKGKGEISRDNKSFLSVPIGFYNQLVGRWDRNLEPIAKNYLLEHLLKDFRPKIPMEVLALLYWSGAVADWENLINDIRPMLYTFWA